MAEYIRNKLQLNRLKQMNITIESEFKDNDGRQYVIATDGSRNDVIRGYEMVEKRYYCGERCIHREKKFQEIAYKYILKQDKETQISCPNCGYEGNLEEFIDGCPYCDTHFNISYTTKTTGGLSMELIIEKIKKMPFIVLRLLIVFFIAFACISILCGEPAGLFVAIMLTPLIGFHALIIGAVVMGAMGMAKMNDIAIFKTIGKNIRKWIPAFSYDCFLTMVNDEIMQRVLEEDENAIDVDVLDYKRINWQMFQDGIVIRLQVQVRSIFWIDGKIKNKTETRIFAFKHHPRQQFVKKQIYRVITCPNCGDSVDMSAGRRCESCGTLMKRMEEWSLEWAENRENNFAG